MTDFLERFFTMPLHVLLGSYAAAFIGGFLSYPVFPDNVLLGFLCAAVSALAYRAAWLIFKGI